MKNSIKLNESQLRKVVEESVTNIIKETVGPNFNLDYQAPRVSELDRQIMGILYQTIQQLKKLNGYGTNGKSNLPNVINEIQQIFNGLRYPNMRTVRYQNESKKNKKNLVNESIKSVDPNNVVPQDVAEQFGFEPEYKGFDGGLELWSKHVDFNPCEDVKQVQMLLSKLGIKRFTSYNWNGGVRITVKPNQQPEVSQPNDNYDYFDPATGKKFGKRPMK